MIVTQMGCCAFNEIGELGDSGSPEQALVEFCENALDTICEDTVGSYKTYLNLGAFYIFTAVVRTKDCDGCAGEYGRNFAAYIRKHKLGIVRETMTRYNRKNEPGHLVKGWVWAPSVRSLTKWYKERGGLSVD